MFRWVTYPLLKAVSLLPFPLLYIISDILFLVLYRVTGYRRKVVQTNLQMAFPDQNDAWRSSVEKKFYRHLADLIVETVKGLSLSRQELLKRMVSRDRELYDQAYEAGRSSIIVMSHAGNWEWVCLSAQLQAYQKAQCIYKPLSHKGFENMMYKMRSRFGTLPIPMDQTLRVMLASDDKCTATAFMGDQNPSNGKNAYWTRFLNQDTAFMWGTEKIARKLNQEVWYMQVRKVRRGHYEAFTRIICENSAQTKEGEITELLARATEQDILSQPEMWLWSHRRWKHRKP